MWIMIAGPYVTGTHDEDGRRAHLRAMNAAAWEVFQRGHLPVIGVNMALPVIEAAGEQHFDRVMMPLSLGLAERCDAVLRIGGASGGADAEMRVIAAAGKPVYRRIEDVPRGDS